MDGISNGIRNQRNFRSGKKLEKAVEILTQNVEEDSSISHVNEVVLNRLVINEYSKSYLVKEVNQENKDGYFVVYKDW